MSENETCCAHLVVRYKTEADHEGYAVGWWECELCATRFESSASLRKELEEKERLTLVYEERIKDLERALAAANERAEKVEIELEECKKRKGKIAAYRIVTEAENVHLRDLLREKPERDMDALIAAFCMVYTSPAWGSDERSPEGWAQKESALRKAFTSAISPEQRFLGDLSILNKLSDDNIALRSRVSELESEKRGMFKPLSAGDIIAQALNGQDASIGQILATYADQKNWKQAYDNDGCHWVWVGPVTCGWELASLASRSKGEGR